jgi:hypothetical protein
MYIFIKISSFLQFEKMTLTFYLRQRNEYIQRLQEIMNIIKVRGLEAFARYDRVLLMSAIEIEEDTYRPNSMLL